MQQLHTVVESTGDKRQGTQPGPPTLFIPIVYFMFGATWVIGGDIFHNWFDGHPDVFDIDHVEIFKGLVFMVLSAGAIRLLQMIEYRRQARIRKRLRSSERDLESERRRLAEILEGTRAGTWEWTIPTGEAIFNDRWAEIVGYSLNELEPISIKTWELLAHPEDLEASNRQLELHFAGETDSYQCESRMRHKNGEWVWVSDRGKVIEWLPDGKPLRMSGTHIDITPQKHAALKLSSLLKMREAVMSCHTAILRHEDEQALYQDVCEILAAKRNYDLVWIAYPNLDIERSISPKAKAGPQAAYVDEIKVRWGDDALGQGPTGTALRTGQLQVVSNIGTSPVYNPWRGAAEKYGFRCSVSVPIRSDGQVLAALNVYSCTEERFDAEEVELLEEFSSHLGLALWMKRVEVERDAVMESLQASSINIVMALAATIEKRDPYTAGHQVRVGQLAVDIAQRLGWEASRIEGLRLGAIIHDIGKIAVPAEILSRPGKLTAGEFSVIKSHPQVGADILAGIKFPWPLQEMILQHHERLDGTGYPRALRGNEIIPEAKIIAVADVVEAITSHRPYRPSLGLHLAKEELLAKRGSAYDPVIVDTCIEIIGAEGFSWEGDKSGFAYRAS